MEEKRERERERERERRRGEKRPLSLTELRAPGVRAR
jgi:hypothetical protein